MKNHYFYLLSTTWKYAVGMRFRLVVTYILFILGNVVTMSEPLVFGKILNTIQIGGPSMLQDVLVYFGVFAGLSLLFWMFHGTARVIERQISFLIIKNFTEKIFDTIASLPLNWHKNNHSGGTINRVKKASTSLKGFTDESYVYIETIVKFIISIGAILFFMPAFGFLPLILGVIIIAVIFKFDAFLGKTLDRINEKEHVVASTLFDYIANIRTVITLRLERLARKEVIRKLMQIFPLYKKNIRVNEIKWFTVSMGLALMNFLILFSYIYHHVTIGQTILIGSLMSLYQYTERLLTVFFNLAWQYEKLVWLRTDVSGVDTIFSAHRELVAGVAADGMVKEWQTIDIRGLTFRYQDEKHQAHHLDNISLQLKRGLRIALVGESGSGKSTLLSLIRGLDEANKVHLQVDGISYKSLRVLSNCVTLIPQDPEIFENTIEYNLTAGIHHTKREINHVVALARFDRVLARLPRGLATSIKEKGVNLSGGEKQRLAVARGLFAAKDSSILLLDEPTSSMDAKNEIAIYKQIFRAFPDTCIVSSVHRLNLLTMFDIIYVFSKGKLIQQGTFKELQKSDGHFQEIWREYLEHSRQSMSAH